jgi:hypothetical protein
MATPTPSLTLVESATSTIASATETCTTAIPDKYGYVPSDSCNSYYNFYPNYGANMAFAILVGLSTLMHIIQAIIYRKVQSYLPCSPPSTRLN